MFKQKFEAVFFDWDNTLVDTWPILLKATNTVLQHFALPSITLEEVKIRSLLSTRESFPERFGDRWQEAQEIFYKAIHDNRDDLKIYDGVIKSIQQLKAKDYKIAIISNKKSEMLREEIKQFNVPSDFVLGSGDTPYDKPNPEMGFIALKYFNLSPQDAVYIGDSITDWKFANNLNMPAIAIGNEDYDGPLFARFDSVNQFISSLIV